MKLAFENHVSIISNVFLLLRILDTSFTKVNTLQQNKKKKSRQHNENSFEKSTILQDIVCGAETKVTFPFVIYKSFNRLQTQISKRRKVVIICHTR